MAAEAKAQKLLDVTLTGGGSSHSHSSHSGMYPSSQFNGYNTSMNDNGESIRRQAVLDYKERKYRTRFEAMTDVAPGPKPLPRLLAKAGMEKMATSTRKKKSVETTTAKDTESIESLKTGLDKDREKEAQSHALSLLRGPGGSYGFH